MAMDLRELAAACGFSTAITDQIVLACEVEGIRLAIDLALLDADDLVSISPGLAPTLKTLYEKAQGFKHGWVRGTKRAIDVAAACPSSSDVPSRNLTAPSPSASSTTLSRRLYSYTLGMLNGQKRRHRMRPSVK